MRSLARRTVPGIEFRGVIIGKSSVSRVVFVLVGEESNYDFVKYINTWSTNISRGPPEKSTTIRTTNQSVKPPSFPQTQKVSLNHILGALVEEQLLVLLETETMREVQEVERQSGKTAVAVAVDAAVVEALDIVVVDIA